jgi:hypothetical protein
LVGNGGARPIEKAANRGSGNGRSRPSHGPDNPEEPTEHRARRERSQGMPSFTAHLGRIQRLPCPLRSANDTKVSQIASFLATRSRESPLPATSVDRRLRPPEASREHIPAGLAYWAPAPGKCSELLGFARILSGGSSRRSAQWQCLRAFPGSATTRPARFASRRSPVRSRLAPLAKLPAVPALRSARESPNRNTCKRAQCRIGHHARHGTSGYELLTGAPLLSDEKPVASWQLLATSLCCASPEVYCAFQK